MRVFGYCRVSTAEQAGSGMSLDQQRQQITGYAMMKGWQVAEFFIEAGMSGSVPLADRPEGQRMLAVLQPGDVIITAKLDRAFRSAVDAVGTLEQLKEDKVALQMIDLGGDATASASWSSRSCQQWRRMSAIASVSVCATPSVTAPPKASTTAANGRSVSMLWATVKIGGRPRLVSHPALRDGGAPLRLDRAAGAETWRTLGDEVEILAKFIG